MTTPPRKGKRVVFWLTEDEQAILANYQERKGLPTQTATFKALLKATGEWLARPTRPNERVRPNQAERARADQAEPASEEPRAPEGEEPCPQVRAAYEAIRGEPPEDRSISYGRPPSVVREEEERARRWRGSRKRADAAEAEGPEPTDEEMQGAWDPTPKAEG